MREIGVEIAHSIVGTGGLLRFGHARVLTSHRDVIHYAHAASLPRLSVLGTGVTPLRSVIRTLYA